MTNGLAEVVQTTGDQHDVVRKPRFGVAKAVFDDPPPLYACQNMLHGHTDLADDPIMLPFILGSLRTWLFLAWLEYYHSCRREGLKATILMQFAIGGKAIRGSFRQGFVVHRTGCRLAQEANFSLAEVADEYIFMRARFFYRCSVPVAPHHQRNAGLGAPSHPSQSCGFHTRQARLQGLRRHGRAHADLDAGWLAAPQSVDGSTHWLGSGPSQTAFLALLEADRP